MLGHVCLTAIKLILIFCITTSHASEKGDIRRLSIKEIEPLVPEIIKKAQQGDPDSQLYLSFIYIKGIAVKRNFNESLKWYNKAARNNQPEAQYGMGWNHLVGRYGFKKDPKTALSWFHKSAAGGYQKSYSMLGQLYRGLRFPFLKDSEKAYYWYKKSAEEGHYPSKARSEFMVGCYEYFGGGGNPINKSLGREYIERSRASGYKPADRYLLTGDPEVLYHMCFYR